MIIVKQAVREIKGLRPLERIELAGRTCYNSLGNMADGTALKFVESLVRRGHYTPTEQVAISIPTSLLEPKMYLVHDHIRKSMDYPRGRLGYCTQEYNGETVQSVMGTARAFFELGIAPELLLDDSVTVVDDYVTLEFLTDRGIANEYVRHRALAYGDDGYVPSEVQHEEHVDEVALVQESTRYVNYNKKDFRIVLPEPCPWAYDTDSEQYKLWYNSCESSYNTYKSMCGTGCAPQIARNVLPLSTATTVVMSGYISQWLAVLNLRLPKDAHPQARYLGAQIFDVLSPKLTVSNCGYYQGKSLKECRDDIMSQIKHERNESNE